MPLGAAQFGLSSGYYAGQGTIAAGLASETQSGQNSFAFGASFVPGYNDVGMQTGIQWHVGHGIDSGATTPLAQWRRLGFTQIDEIIPDRKYLCVINHQLYRVSITARLGEVDSWRAKIDQYFSFDGIHYRWERTTLPTLPLSTTFPSAVAALQQTIVELAASVTH